MPSATVIRKAASIFVPFSVFISPFLLVTAEWHPSIINPLLKNYLVTTAVLVLWSIFLSAVRLFVAGGEKCARSKPRYVLEILLLVITGLAALIALHFLRQGYPPPLFYLTLASVGFLSLEFGLVLREKTGLALLMRFLFLNCLCALAFQIAVPGFNWQLLVFGLAVAVQASSLYIRKYAEQDPSRASRVHLLKISIFAGPVLVGLLALLRGILIKYLLAYILLPVAAKVVKDTERQRIVAEFYWLFLATLLVARLL